MQSWSLAAYGDSATSVTISAENAKTYVVGVRAGNDHGWSAWVNSAAAGPYVPPLPDPPGAVSSVSTTRADGTLTASWDAPSGAAKYHVTYTTDWGQTWTSAADAHASTSITIGADNARAYTVGVRAGNDGGWSAWTNSPTAHSYFPPERGIRIQDSGGNAITALAVPEGGEASYQVLLTAAPSETTKVCVYISVRDKNDPDITFKGEAADVVSIDVIFTPDNWNIPQTVTLVAAEDDDYANGARDSGLDARDYYAGKVDLAVTEIDNDAPPAPASVNVTRADGALTVSGYAVDGASKYHVTYSSDGMQSWTAASDSHGESSITISGIDNDATYVVGVRAGADGGWSGWTNSEANAPLSAPTGFTVTNGDGYFELAWSAVDDATGYDVRAKVNNGNSWTSVATGITATSYKYTTSDAVNKLAVRATNAGGASAWSELSRGPNDEWLNTVQQPGASAQSLVMAAANSGASAQSQLAAPASITVTRENYIRDEKLYVSWSAVSGASGYNLACANQPSTQPLSSWTWWHCGSVTSGSTTTFTVDDDKRGGITRDLGYKRSYAVAVRAVTNNAADASNWAMSVNADPALPPDPGSITTSRATGSVSISWTPAPFSQGYKIYCAVRENNVNGAYTVCANVATQTVTDGKVSATISSWTADGTNYTIDDNKTYSLSITTTNTWGESWGSLAQPILPDTELTVSNIGATTATLNIAKHSGNWYYKANRAPDNTCKGPVSGSSKDLTGLTANASYTYSVYSDSRCSSSNRLDTAARFTTLSYVSNLTSTKQSTDSDIASLSHQAVAFTTGANAGGYVLKSVTVPLRYKGSNRSVSAGVTLTLHAMEGTGEYSSTSQVSDTVLATLSGTAPTGSAWTDTTFTCSGSGCQLSANATYFIKAATDDVSPAYAWAWAASETQTQQPSGAGWDIKFGHNLIPGQGRTWSSYSDWNIAEFAFETVPSLTSSNVTATGATLAIAGHSGNWYYKSTTTGKTDCAGPVSGASVNVTGLTANTAYTFSAYSDSGCTTGNLLVAAAEFTTPAAPTLTSSNVTATGATLTIANHTGNWYYKYTSPSGGTCSATAVTGTSTTVTLTGGTTYTFAAYSDSSCSTLVATAAAFTTPTPVSVSNITGSESGSTDVGQKSHAEYQAAQAFTTGSNSGGYTLSNIAIGFGASTGDPDASLVVTLHAASGSNPASTVLATLSGSNRRSLDCRQLHLHLLRQRLRLVGQHHLLRADEGLRPGSANGNYYSASLTDAAETKQPSNNAWSIADSGRQKISTLWTAALGLPRTGSR